MVETTRRQAIEDVASDLFRDRGYAATSVRDIARALDIQGASLYAHVASQEDVLWSIVDTTATAFERRADAALDGRPGEAPGDGARGDPVDRLAARVEAHVETVTKDPERASVFITEWR